MEDPGPACGCGVDGGGGGGAGAGGTNATASSSSIPFSSSPSSSSSAGGRPPVASASPRRPQQHQQQSSGSAGAGAGTALAPSMQCVASTSSSTSGDFALVGPKYQSTNAHAGGRAIYPTTTHNAQPATHILTHTPTYRLNPAAEGFQVTAAWSVAGVGTCIQLRHRAFGLHIALDMGTSAGEVCVCVCVEKRSLFLGTDYKCLFVLVLKCLVVVEVEKLTD